MIIAIGGPSNSGKSSLARIIAQQYPSDSVTVVCQDNFVFPEKDLTMVKGHIDWENPDTIDFKLFEAGIKEASIHHELVIVEGFLIYSNPEMIPLFDKMIFVSIGKEAFFQRKSHDLRWGKEPDWYIEYVWEKFQVFGMPPAGQDMLLLNGEDDWPMERILSFLNN